MIIETIQKEVHEGVVHYDYDHEDSDFDKYLLDNESIQEIFSKKVRVTIEVINNK